jgi:hypothetical protein
MAKRQTFADKVAHAAARGPKNCPQCGSPVQWVRLVSSEPSPKGAYRFNQKMVSVCKCNTKEIYG